MARVGQVVTVRFQFAGLVVNPLEHRASMIVDIIFSHKLDIVHYDIVLSTLEGNTFSDTAVESYPSECGLVVKINIWH